MHEQHAPSSSHSSSAVAHTENIIRSVYRGFLGREPDLAGMQYWIETISTTGDAAALLHGIVNSDEYKRKITEQASRKYRKDEFAKQAKEIFPSRPLTIVDVGAQDLEGEDHVYSAISAYELPHQIIGFEPLEAKIAERRQRHPDEKITLFPTFIGDGARHLFHINNYDATSSLLPLNEAVTKDLVGLSTLHTVKTESVSTKRMDDVLGNFSHIDFLKLDIQGFELPVLNNARETLRKTNVVHCETSFAEIYRDQALFSEIESTLREMGFYFLDFYSLCRYPYHTPSKIHSEDRLGWGDAVFFKDQKMLESPQDIAAQAAIALLVYDKHSLAESLAQRYDDMCGSRLASVFRGMDR